MACSILIGKEERYPPAGESVLFHHLDLPDIRGLAGHIENVALLDHEIRRWNEDKILGSEFLDGKGMNA